MYDRYDMDLLFNTRDVVGSKLEQIIHTRGYTKSGVCAGANISRPTLDKLLNGEVTNKTNFEKHITKLLAHLSLTPSELMGNIIHPFTNAKSLRKALRIELEDLSRISGVSVETLKKLDSGEDVPLEDLRDIALCLGTGVRGVLGDGYFQTQIAHLDDFVDNDPTTIHSPGGYWGHLGLRLKGQDNYMWFPITAFTRNLIDQVKRREFMAVPCMDNSLLLIHCEAIEELFFLDDASDRPYSMDWGDDISQGEIPAIMYEAFEDYTSYKEYSDDPSEVGLSKKLIAAMDAFVSNKSLEAIDFLYELHNATVFFTSGRTNTYHLCFDTSDDSIDLTFTVRSIYETGSLFDDDIICLSCDDGFQSFLHLKNTALIKLPLAFVQDLIKQDFDETQADEEKHH